MGFLASGDGAGLGPERTALAPGERRLGSGPWDQDLAAWIANSTTLALLACALLVGFATKGRHPAWCALLVVSALVGWR